MLDSVTPPLLVVCFSASTATRTCIIISASAVITGVLGQSYDQIPSKPPMILMNTVKGVESFRAAHL